ncbi:hypothetical protein VNO77_01206 [Canavalia gladiata]|uniref:Uncharacterized protein n=1 Tax=Canavalia gladiata TaxID=3824 RepID=A0AAN9RA15_CANGL
MIGCTTPSTSGYRTKRAQRSLQRFGFFTTTTLHLSLSLSLSLKTRNNKYKPKRVFPGRSRVSIDSEKGY